jgi:hypothetical protein
MADLDDTLDGVGEGSRCEIAYWRRRLACAIGRPALVARFKGETLW